MPVRRLIPDVGEFQQRYRIDGPGMSSGSIVQLGTHTLHRQQLIAYLVKHCGEPVGARNHSNKPVNLGASDWRLKVSRASVVTSLECAGLRILSGNLPKRQLGPPDASQSYTLTAKGSKSSRDVFANARIDHGPAPTLASFGHSVVAAGD